MEKWCSPCFCRVRESLGEFKKAVRKKRAYRLVPKHFLFSQTSTSISVTRLKHDTFEKYNSRCGAFNFWEYWAVGDLKPFHTQGILLFPGCDKDAFLQSLLRIFESLFGFLCRFFLCCWLLEIFWYADTSDIQITAQYCRELSQGPFESTSFFQMQTCPRTLVKLFGDRLRTSFDLAFLLRLLLNHLVLKLG